MSTTRVFVGRLAGISVFDPVGDKVGRVRDVLVVYRSAGAPRVVGIIVEIPGKKRVFVSIGRITSIGAGQVITTGLINVRRFEQRGGETRVIAEMIGRNVTFADKSGTAVIEDVAIHPSRSGEWFVSELFVRRPKTSNSPFSRGATELVSWSQVGEDHATDAQHSATHLAATYSDLKPADLANSLLELPSDRMLAVITELSDHRVADALEEMTEDDQAIILTSLKSARAADVLDHMEPDDAADIIAHLPEDAGAELLDLMEPEEAEDVRRLLEYGPDSAGGLMSPTPIVLSAESTIAEGLALIRKQDFDPAMAAAVFVTLPPYECPTGKLLGVAHFQRMLRYPPNERLSSIIDAELEPVGEHTSAAEVSRRLAIYNLVSLPVVDSEERLVGVVTIDDVLDYLLPDDWRAQGDHDSSSPPSPKRGS